MKYKYYVGILMNDHKMKFVTKVDRESKCAYWKDGEPAMTFTKTGAENLQFGLVANGYCAAVVKLPDFYEMCNPAKEGE